MLLPIAYAITAATLTDNTMLAASQSHAPEQPRTNGRWRRAVIARAAGFVALLQRYLDYRHTLGQLSELSDYQLRDIGLERCDITARNLSPAVRSTEQADRSPASQATTSPESSAQPCQHAAKDRRSRPALSWIELQIEPGKVPTN